MNMFMGFANTFSYDQYRQKNVSICAQKTCGLNPYYYPIKNDEDCYDGYHQHFGDYCIYNNLQNHETDFEYFLEKYSIFEKNNSYFYKATPVNWYFTALMFSLFSVVYFTIFKTLFFMEDDLIHIFLYIIFQWSNIFIYNIIIGNWINSDSLYFINNGESWKFLKTLESHNNLYYNFFIQTCLFIFFFIQNLF